MSKKKRFAKLSGKLPQLTLAALMANSQFFGAMPQAHAGAGTITVKDAGGTTRTFDVITDGSGNFVGMHGVCDGSAAAQCASVLAGTTAPTGANLPLVIAIHPNGSTVSVANVNPNGSTSAANSSPVVLANNQTAGDPCMFQAKTFTAISSAVGSSLLVAGLSGKKIFGCSFAVIGASAANLSIIEGTGTTCLGGSVASVIGSTGAAGGMALAANGGLTFGSGEGTIFQAANATNGICLLQSTTGLFAGVLGYVQQ